MSQQSKKKKHILIWILVLTTLTLVFIFCIILLIAGYVLFNKITQSAPTDTLPVENVNNYYGYIEGSLGYPSDYIPAMGICAKNKNTKEEFCTYKLIGDTKYTYDIGYILQVPAGTYNVYAQLVDEDTGSWLGDPYKAYYSDYVTCAVNIFECTSHKPIDVIVGVNQITPEIDPQDWYADL